MVKCYLEHMPGWSLRFVIQGLGTDSHSDTSRKRGFIMKVLVAWDGKPSRMRQLRGLPTLVATWSGSCASAGSVRMPSFLQLQVDPSVDSQNSLLRGEDLEKYLLNKWLTEWMGSICLMISSVGVCMCEKNILTFETKASPLIYFLIIAVGKLNEEKLLCWSSIWLTNSYISF